MLEIENIKISVIVPIYNVKLYVERCVRSLMEQTLGNIEFVFVNDCTPDESMDILQCVLEDYPTRKEQVRIIEHEGNCGLAVVRNTGLKSATGQYIIHCDSDDWVEKDMYEKLLRKALETGADVVGCDFCDDYVTYSVTRKQVFPQDSKEAVNKMLRGELHCSAWNKLVARSLYERTNICFPEGVNMWEDVSTIIPLCFHANKIAYVPEVLYHYTHCNTNSYLTCMSQTSLNNLIEAVKLMESFLKQQEVYDRYTNDLCFLKLTVKLNLLLNTRGKQQKEWNILYPEANTFICQSTHISIYWRGGLQLAAWHLLPLFNLVVSFGKVLRSLRRK